jgi:plasmid stability protein
MPNITLKNIPHDLYERLKRAADEHRRSINSEVLVCLENALITRRAEPEELLARLRAVRRRAGDAPLGDAEVTAAKRADRP